MLAKTNRKATNRHTMAAASTTNPTQRNALGLSFNSETVSTRGGPSRADWRTPRRAKHGPRKPRTIVTQKGGAVNVKVNHSSAGCVYNPRARGARTETKAEKREKDGGLQGPKREMNRG